MAHFLYRLLGFAQADPRTVVIPMWTFRFSALGFLLGPLILAIMFFRADPSDPGTNAGTAQWAVVLFSGALIGTWLLGSMGLIIDGGKAAWYTAAIAFTVCLALSAGVLGSLGLSGIRDMICNNDVRWMVMLFVGINTLLAASLVSLVSILRRATQPRS